MSVIRANGKVPNRKYARELLRHLPKGYRIAYGEIVSDDQNAPARPCGDHPLLFDPDGGLVRVGGRPVRLRGTPSGRRALHNDLAAIRRAGVPVS